jgi:glyoxylase-like metal-dependent hydrolase (beta-lactamase superfamily II)
MIGDELRPGLWRWTAFHEEWKEDVGCVAIAGGDEIVLIDPLLPAADEERFFAALDRPTHVLITVFWHVRSCAEIARRAGARIWAYSRARPAIARRRGGVADQLRRGDELPGGISAHSARRRSEVLYWLPAHRALVAGDVLLGDDGRSARLCPPSWLPRGTTAAELAQSLRPLLELPVELLLVSHGPPVLQDGRRALANALQTT